MFTKTSKVDNCTFFRKYSKLLIVEQITWKECRRPLKKRWLAVVIAGIILSLGSVTSSMAAEDNGQEDGTYKNNCWEKINGSWYYFNADGFMCTGWARIGGIEYLFGEKGDLQLGWCYNEKEEKWHYYNQDGSPQKGWIQDQDGNWYWFSEKGEMASSGYKYISGSKYYFYDNGQMAFNQFVGLSYMDGTGVNNKNFDIVIEGSQDSSSISAENKELFTEAFKNIPRDWVKRFIDEGWEILYYPDKQYFSSRTTENGIYYVCHKLDTSYKKIKICNLPELTEAFSEFIGYEYGCYDERSQEAMDLLMDKSLVEKFVNIPEYYEDDIKVYFGQLAGVYLKSESTRAEMEETAPDVTRILKKILYGQS